MDDILVLSLPSAYSREFLFFLSFLLAAAAGFGQSVGGYIYDYMAQFNAAFSLCLPRTCSC